MRRSGVSTSSKAAALVGALAVVILGLLLAGPGNTSQKSLVVISSVVAEWDGTSYELITTPYDNGTAPLAQQDGVDLYIGFEAGGPGFGPNSTFVPNLLTPWFTVNWVEYCSSSQGWQGQLVTGYRYPGVNAYLTAAPPITTAGCFSGDYAYSGVPIDAMEPGSLVEMVFSLAFPSAGYSGPVTLSFIPTKA